MTWEIPITSPYAQHKSVPETYPAEIRSVSRNARQNLASQINRAEPTTRSPAEARSTETGVAKPHTASSASRAPVIGTKVLLRNLLLEAYQIPTSPEKTNAALIRDPERNKGASTSKERRLDPHQIVALAQVQDNSVELRKVQALHRDFYEKAMQVIDAAAPAHREELEREHAAAARDLATWTQTNPIMSADAMYKRLAKCRQPDTKKCDEIMEAQGNTSTVPVEGSPLDDPAVKKWGEHQYLEGYLDCTIADELRTAEKEGREMPEDTSKRITDPAHRKNPDAIGRKIGFEFGWAYLCDVVKKPELDDRLVKKRWSVERLEALSPNCKSIYMAIQVGWLRAQKEFVEKVETLSRNQWHTVGGTQSASASASETQVPSSQSQQTSGRSSAVQSKSKARQHNTRQGNAQQTNARPTNARQGNTQQTNVAQEEDEVIYCRVCKWPGHKSYQRPIKILHGSGEGPGRGQGGCHGRGGDGGTKGRGSGVGG